MQISETVVDSVAEEVELATLVAPAPFFMFAFIRCNKNDTHQQAQSILAVSQN